MISFGTISLLMHVICEWGPHADLLCIIPMLTDVKGVVYTRKQEDARAEFPPIEQYTNNMYQRCVIGREEDAADHRQSSSAVKASVIASYQLLVRHETSEKKGENRLQLSAVMPGAC